MFIFFACSTRHFLNCWNSLSHECFWMSKSRETQLAYWAAVIEHFAIKVGYLLRRSLALRTDSILFAIGLRWLRRKLRNFYVISEENVVDRSREKGQKKSWGGDNLNGERMLSIEATLRNDVARSEVLIARSDWFHINDADSYCCSLGWSLLVTLNVLLMSIPSQHRLDDFHLTQHWRIASRTSWQRSSW